MSKKHLKTQTHSTRNLKAIPINLIDPHPMNEEMFRTSIPDMNELERNIALNGQLQPAHVYEQDGRFVLISGHKRREVLLKLAYETMVCEVVDKPQSHGMEVFLLYSYNVGRNLRPAWKIKLWKLLNQLVCQLRENLDVERVADEYDSELGVLVTLVTDRGIQVQGVKTWKIINELLGLSLYEQNNLKKIFDDEYLDGLIKSLPAKTRDKHNVENHIRNEVNSLRSRVYCEDVSVLEAAQYIDSIESQIAELTAKSAKADKPKKSKQSDLQPESVEVIDDRVRDAVTIDHAEFENVFMFEFDITSAVVLTPSLEDCSMVGLRYNEGENVIALNYDSGVALFTQRYLIQQAVEVA